MLLRFFACGLLVADGDLLVVDSGLLVVDGDLLVVDSGFFIGEFCLPRIINAYLYRCSSYFGEIPIPDFFRALFLFACGR